VPRYFVTPEDRWLFSAIATWGMAMAVFMALDDSSSQRVWGYPIWLAMLGFGGMLTLAFTVRMASMRLRGLAAAMMVVGSAGRGAGLAMGVLNHTARTTWSGMLGIGVWSMLAFLLYFTWRSRVPLPGGPRGWRDG
jgi:hypothetical protein